MSVCDNDVKTFTCLGLTEREARIFLALIYSGPAPIKTISKISTVARQDTYRVIAKLYKKGLVEKMVTNPTTFKAISLQKAIDILLQDKAAEIESTRARTNKLLGKFAKKRSETILEEPQFSLISGSKKLTIEASENAAKSKKSIDLAGPWEVFLRYILSSTESLRKTKENKVVCRVIINKPENKRAFARIENFLKNRPNFHLKYTDKETPLLMCIHDKKLVALALSTKFDLASSDLLRSTNEPFAKIIQNYFDSLWIKLS